MIFFKKRFISILELQKMTGYCVRCKSKTGDKNPHMVHTKNGRTMIKSSCSKCGTTKCQFTSGDHHHKHPQNHYKRHKKKPMKGKGAIGSLLGSVAGSLGGNYIAPGFGAVIGEQIGKNLGDLIPF